MRSRAKSLGVGRLVPGLTVLALVALVGPSAAQELGSAPCGSTEGIEAGPRLSEWIRARQAKCQKIEPYKSTFLERQILAFEKAERRSIAEVNLFGFYPRVQTIDHRSQWAGGLRFWRPDLGHSRVDLSGNAFVSHQGFRYYEVQAGVIPHRGQAFPLFASKMDDVFELANVRRDADQGLMLYGSFTHRYSPKYDFFGVGPDSSLADQSDFLQRDTLYEGVAGYRVLPRLTLATRMGHYRVMIGRGKDDTLPDIEDTFGPAGLPGFLARPRDYLRSGASAIWDSRDRRENPHGGAVLAIEWQRYGERGGGGSRFDRYAADARAYVSLGHPQRVLALRAYVSEDRPGPPGSRVPFYLLRYLGGSHSLRSIANQRYRGEKVALLQAEYRWEASPAIELSLFLDSGAVAATREDELGALMTDGGFGIRLKTHEALLLRCDLAWGDEGFKLLFRFSPAF